MRRWLYAGGVLLLAAAGAFAYALARLDRYLTEQRPALQAEASAVLGRAVTFDSLGVSLRGGASARVTNLAIADAARFGSAPFLTAARAEVGLELLPALRGEYHIRRVVLRDPVVTLQRDAQGWNVASFAALGSAAFDRMAPAGTAAAPTPGATRTAPDAPLPVAALLIAAATIDGGRVQLIDHTRQPPLTLQVEQLRMQAHDLAPGRPVAFDLSAAILGSATPNFTARGRLDPGAQPNADVQVTWLPVDLAALTPLVPALEGRAVS
ncbi:MAG: DUF748 domain-containing protein, partial [bacterium]